MEEGTLPGTMFGLARRSFLKGHLPTFGVQPPTHAPLQAAGDPTLSPFMQEASSSRHGYF